MFLACGLFFGVLLCPSEQNWAIANVNANSGEQSDYSIEYYIQAFADTDQGAETRDYASIEKISKISGDAWSQMPQRGLSLGFSKDIVWLKAEVQNYSTERQIKVWNFPNHRLTSIRQFTRNSAGSWQITQSGAYTPQSEQVVQGRNFSFRVSLEPGETSIHYFRIESFSSMRILLKLYTLDESIKLQNTENLFFGIFYGILLGLILYNISLSREFRDPTYLLYVLTVVLVFLFFSSFDGFGYLFVYGEFPQFGFRLQSTFGTLYAVSYLTFVSSFLKINRKIKTLFKTNLVVTAVAVIFSFLNLGVLAPDIGNRLVTYNAVMILPLAVLNIVLGYSKNEYGINLFLMGNLAQAVFAAIFLSMLFGLIPSNSFTVQSLRIGTLLEMVFFSIAIGRKIGASEAQKNIATRSAALKTEFAATLSHEIRSPLTAVIGASEMLAGTPLNEKQQGLVKLLNGASGFLYSLVNDVLTLTKLEAGKINLEKNEINIADFISEFAGYFEIQCTAKNIDFKTENQLSDNLSIKADKTRLKQIIMNLLGNALKFTPTDGQIILRVKKTHHEQVDFLVFEVQDSGIGIDAENLHKVFDEYEQADDTIEKSYGGTGLGLPISRKLAQLLNGSLEVSSQPGQGTIFSLKILIEPSLNISVQAVDEHRNIQKEFSALQRPLKILHIDDDADMRMIFSLYFNDTVHHLESFSNPVHALEQTRVEKFDFIFTDMHMPEMSGLEFIEHLREILTEDDVRRVRLVLCSGSLDLSDSKVKSQVDAVLKKPFRAVDLYRVILDMYL